MLDIQEEHRIVFLFITFDFFAIIRDAYDWHPDSS
jgi:hypothetical protein